MYYLYYICYLGSLYKIDEFVRSYRLYSEYIYGSRAARATTAGTGAGYGVPTILPS
jgi:hypothetical protein